MSFQQDHEVNYLYQQSQRGVAVIMALFIVAIIAAMSYAMLSSLARDIHRTEMIQRDLALTYHAQGGIHWAFDHLRMNVLKKTADQRVDVMPYVSPVNEENGYRVVTRIHDMQSRYNINRLSDPTKTDNKDEFVRLLRALKINLEPKKLDALVDAIRDWLNKSEGRPDLNRYYAELPIPYRAAHQPMVHISELRLVKGMTAELYEKLSPYLVALPTSESRINILTALPPVLTTLNEKVTLDKAVAIAKAVATMQISDPARLQKLPLIENLGVISEQFVVVSDYFLIETSVSVESQQLVIYTLIERKSEDPKKISLTIIWQSKGIA
jgi:general secretion pathway protein K